MLGYLFFVGDRDKTDLAYRRRAARRRDDWLRLRHEEALTPEAVVRLAEAAHARYGFNDFKLKGGVLAGEQEMEAVTALAERFPDARITLDPNGAWSLDEAIDAVPRADRRARLRRGSVRRRGRLLRVARSWPSSAGHRAADRHQHDRHRLARDGPRHRAAAVDIPLADPHFWTMQGSVRVAQLCHAWGLTWGSHSNNHFDVSLAMFTHVAAAAPGESRPSTPTGSGRTASGITKEPLADRRRLSDVPDKPGLGVELDDGAVAAAHQLYQRDGARRA